MEVEFFAELGRQLQYLNGKVWLSSWAQFGIFFPAFQSADLTMPLESDAIAFLLEAEDRDLLDAVEQIFRVSTYTMLFKEPNALVNDINAMFAEDGLPYYLTQFTWEESLEVGGKRVSAYPQIVYPREEMPDDSENFER